MPRKAMPPPVKCSARSKRTGERCKRWAHPGTTVCNFHGAYAGRAGPQNTKDKANASSVLATVMDGERRQPWEVVAHATHLADSLMRDMEASIRNGEADAEMVDRLTEAVRLSHSLAASAITTKAYELRTAVDARAQTVITSFVADLAAFMGVATAGGAMSGKGVLPQALSEYAGPALQALAAGDAAPQPDGPPLLERVLTAIAEATADRMGMSQDELLDWQRSVAIRVLDGRDTPELPAAVVTDDEPDAIENAVNSLFRHDDLPPEPLPQPVPVNTGFSPPEPETPTMSKAYTPPIPNTAVADARKAEIEKQERGW